MQSKNLKKVNKKIRLPFGNLVFVLIFCADDKSGVEVGYTSDNQKDSASEEERVNRAKGVCKDAHTCGGGEHGASVCTEIATARYNFSC